MANKSRFGSELSEAEINALVDNATPSNTKKVTKFGMKIFNGMYLIFLMPYVIIIIILFFFFLSGTSFLQLF